MLFAFSDRYKYLIMLKKYIEYIFLLFNTITEKRQKANRTFKSFYKRMRFIDSLVTITT